MKKRYCLMTLMCVAVGCQAQDPGILERFQAAVKAFNQESPPDAREYLDLAHKLAQESVGAHKDINDAQALLIKEKDDMRLLQDVAQRLKDNEKNKDLAHQKIDTAQANLKKVTAGMNELAQKLYLLKGGTQEVVNDLQVVDETARAVTKVLNDTEAMLGSGNLLTAPLLKAVKAHTRTLREIIEKHEKNLADAQKAAQQAAVQAAKAQKDANNELEKLAGQENPIAVSDEPKRNVNINMSTVDRHVERALGIKMVAVRTDNKN